MAIGNSLNARAYKTDVNTAVRLKANTSYVYSKAEINDHDIAFGASLNARAFNIEVATALALKATTTDVYSNNESNTFNIAFTCTLIKQTDESNSYSKQR